jgi:hypothetical protein
MIKQGLSDILPGGGAAGRAFYSRSRASSILMTLTYYRRAATKAKVASMFGALSGKAGPAARAPVGRVIAAGREEADLDPAVKAKIDVLKEPRGEGDVLPRRRRDRAGGDRRRQRILRR